LVSRERANSRYGGLTWSPGGLPRRFGGPPKGREELNRRWNSQFCSLPVFGGVVNQPRIGSNPIWEPNLFTTSSLAPAVDSETASTAQIGQYLGKTPLSICATGLAGSAGTPRRRPRGQVSQSLSRGPHVWLTVAKLRGRQLWDSNSPTWAGNFRDEWCR
jgi:hypothetical protein